MITTTPSSNGFDLRQIFTMQVSGCMAKTVNIKRQSESYFYLGTQTNKKTVACHSQLWSEIWYNLKLSLEK